MTGSLDTSKTSNEALDFEWTTTDEPHASRRAQMLAKYGPEIKALYGKEIRTFYICIFILVTQVALSYYTQFVSWPVYLFIAYAYGGTVNHTLQLAAHEISHNRVFQSTKANKWCGILSNFATGFPSAITFQRYHMEHHQKQGVDSIDQDIPTDYEVQFIGHSTFWKFWFVVFQSFFYALRPVIMKPKKKVAWEYTNIICQVAFDAALIYFLGYQAFLYLALSTFLGLGLHPCAGHFIAEHYTLVKGHETYSYYGICNRFNLNVGYHNEHHDFPLIPWSNLPKVREIAPEFYDEANHPQYNSYLWVIWKYITDPTIGPNSRVKRKDTSDTSDDADTGLGLAGKSK